MTGLLRRRATLRVPQRERAVELAHAEEPRLARGPERALERLGHVARHDLSAGGAGGDERVGDRVEVAELPRRVVALRLALRDRAERRARAGRRPRLDERGLARLRRRGEVPVPVAGELLERDDVEPDRARRTHHPTKRLDVRGRVVGTTHEEHARAPRLVRALEARAKLLVDEAVRGGSALDPRVDPPEDRGRFEGREVPVGGSPREAIDERAGGLGGGREIRPRRHRGIGGRGFDWRWRGVDAERGLPLARGARDEQRRRERAPSHVTSG